MSRGVATYTIPKRKETLGVYTRQVRRKFELTPEDGVTDEAFYGK